MSLPWAIEERIESWFKEDIAREWGEQDSVLLSSHTNTSTKFYCCNCTRHLDIKFKAHIVGRRQSRCIDCHKIITGKSLCSESGIIKEKSGT